MSTYRIFVTGMWILMGGIATYLIYQTNAHPEYAIQRQELQEHLEKAEMDAKLQLAGWGDCEFKRIGGLMTIRCPHSSTTTITGGKYSKTTTVDSP